MIKFLASVFRGFSFIFGVTAPPPDQDQRPFVLIWLAIIAISLAFAVILFYAISHVHLS